jgi:hypothetical protein
MEEFIIKNTEVREKTKRRLEFVQDNETRVRKKMRFKWKIIKR